MGKCIENSPVFYPFFIWLGWISGFTSFLGTGTGSPGGVGFSLWDSILQMSLPLCLVWRLQTHLS